MNLTNLNKADRVRAILADIPQYRNEDGAIEANVTFVLSQLTATGTPEESTIRDVIKRLEGQLAESSEFKEVVRSFFQRHPEYQNVQANRGLLIWAINKYKPSLTDFAVDYLISNGTIQLTVSHQHVAKVAHEKQVAHAQAIADQQYEADAQEADQLAQELLSPYLDRYGHKKSHIHPLKFAEEKERLANMSLHQLRAEKAQRVEANRIKNLTAADYAKEQGLRTETTGTRLSRMYYDSTHPAADPRGYLRPNSQTLEHPEGQFTPWSSRLLQLLPPATIRQLIRTYGERQLDEICRKGDLQ